MMLSLWQISNQMSMYILCVLYVGSTPGGLLVLKTYASYTRVHTVSRVKTPIMFWSETLPVSSKGASLNIHY